MSAEVKPIANSLISYITPSRQTVYRGLNVGLATAAVFSIVPAYRMTGALALRSIILLRSTYQAAEAYNRSESFFSRDCYRSCAKIAIAALGLAGLAKGQPMLIVLSLTADIAYNFFNVFDSRSNTTLDGIKCPVVIISNSLMIGALLTGSWTMVVVAAAMNYVFFYAKTMDFYTRATGPSSYIDVLSNVVLDIVQVAVFRRGAIPPSEYPTLPIGR
jgi:hypothetical protein